MLHLELFQRSALQTANPIFAAASFGVSADLGELLLRPTRGIAASNLFDSTKASESDSPRNLRMLATLKQSAM